MIWLLQDLQTKRFKAYNSFKRLANDIGLLKNIEKPSMTLRIGDKYEIRQVEYDERI